MTRKLLLLFGLLWSAVASAQFTPGQILTAAELNSQFALYAPLAGATFTGPISATGLTGTPISGSTGSFTQLAATSSVIFPAGSLSLSDLATESANTVVANATGSAATPTAISVPSCSTSSSALQWTSSTGFACNTAIAAATATTATNSTQLGGVAAASYLTSASAASTYAPLASPTFTGTPTVPGYLTTASAASTYAPLASPTFTGTVSAAALTVTGNLTPSQTSGIVGTTTNNNANTGSVGEYPAPTNLSSVPLTTATNTNLASITLTAGDWDVSGVADFIPAGTTLPTTFIAGISTTTASFGTFDTFTRFNLTFPAGQAQIFQTPTVRISVASSTTVFLVGLSVFTVSTSTASGFIRARRVR